MREWTGVLVATMALVGCGRTGELLPTDDSVASEIDFAKAPDLAVALDFASSGDLAAPSDLAVPDAFQWPPADGGCVPGGGGVGQSGSLFGALQAVALPSGMSAATVAIGDVTGDGRADVLVGIWPSNGGVGGALLVYPQTAAGALATPLSYASGTAGPFTPRDVRIGDLNGDGRLDAVIVRSVDLGLFLQNTSGAFDPVVALPPLTSGGNGEDLVAVGDVNGDGRDDIVGGGWGAATIDVWLQTAQGTLAPPTSYACPHGGFNVIALGDLNGDGLLDIAVSGEDQYSACVLLQQSGGFAPYVTVPIQPGAQGLAIGDVTGDCLGDLVYTGGGNRPNPWLGVAAQRAQGALSPATLFPSYDIPGTVAIADVDGDGRGDAIVVHTVWLAVGVYRQLPGGSLATEDRYSFGSVQDGADTIAVGDVNGDGRPDIVGASSPSLSILYHQ